MNLTIENDNLLIQTDQEIDEPYLKKTTTGYKTYWHFIRDFHKKYKEAPITVELQCQLKAKVEEVKKYRGLIEDPMDTAELKSFLNHPYEPREFQGKAVRFIVNQCRVLLADDTGTGKSIMALLSMLYLIEHKNLTKFIVVVPASLRLQWLSECRKFINKDMFPDVEVIVNSGDGRTRKFVYKRFRDSGSTQIMITSYDAIRRDAKLLKDLPVDMIVADEAQAFKTRTTKINKAMRKYFKHVKYRLCMTATPIENGLEDLYSICEFTDKRRLHSKAYFECKYCEIELVKLWHRNITINKVVGYKNLKDVKEKLTGMYIRRTVDDVELELPELISQNIVLDLSKAQDSLYKEVSGEINGDMTRDDLIGQLTYLQEICDSTELLDANIKSSSKVDEIKRMVREDLKYSKVIMITKYEKFANILKRELGKSVLLITGKVKPEKRQYIIKEFENSVKHNVLIGTTAIQAGLNLQVASILVNVDLPYNPSSLKQRIGRIKRIGSEHKTIRMINLITRGTMEEKILDILYEKGCLFEKMFSIDEDVKMVNLLGMTRDELREMV